MNGPLLRAPSQGIITAALTRSAIETTGPALGLIEVTSLARGVVVADAMVKRALVRLALVRPVSGGKHLSLCTGEVAEVQEAMQAGLAVAGGVLCDRLLLTQVHEELVFALSPGPGAPALAARFAQGWALGLVETFSAAAALSAADSACKAAEVRIVGLRLCDGVGGKGFFLLGGEQDMVEAALWAAERATVPGLFHSRELIPRPHEDLVEALQRG